MVLDAVWLGRLMRNGSREQLAPISLRQWPFALTLADTVSGALAAEAATVVVRILAR
jgi:uncharacterized membrane protein